MISQAIPAPSASLTDEDLCEIWDPEKYELSELEKLKRHDQWCFDKGLPHPWDLLSIEALPTLMSWVTSPVASSTSAPPSDAERAGAGAPSWAGDTVLRLLRSVREVLEEQMKRGPLAPKPYSHDMENDTDHARRS